MCRGFDTNHPSRRLSSLAVIPTGRHLHATLRTTPVVSIIFSGHGDWDVWTAQTTKKMEGKGCRHDECGIHHDEYSFTWRKERTGNV